MADLAAGTWTLVRSDNLEEYMKAVGVGYMGRKLAAGLRPTQEISVEGDNWYIKTITTLRTSEISFTLGQPFDENAVDGRKTKTVVHLEGQTLIQHQQGDPDSVVTRHFQHDTMTMSLTARGVTATRIYKKQKADSADR